MPELSILLPSLRRDAARQRIEEFAQTNGDTDYEIVLVSPFDDLRGDRVVNVPEPEACGSVAGTITAYEHSSAPYLAYWSDDVSPTPRCLTRMLDFVKGKPAPFIGSFRVRDLAGREFPHRTVYGRLYADWGCLSRESIDEAGGFFDAGYRVYWADPDLSLRTWLNNGCVGICPDEWIERNDIADPLKESNRTCHFLQDAEVFLDRWHAQMGDGLKRAWYEVNKEYS